MSDEEKKMSAVAVGQMYLLADSDGQIGGVDWSWTADAINSPEHAVVAINALRRAVGDVGWTTRVVMSAGRLPEAGLDEPVEEKE